MTDIEDSLFVDRANYIINIMTGPECSEMVWEIEV